MSFSKLSAVDIVKSLKEGQYTCEEIAKSFIEQIKQEVEIDTIERIIDPSAETPANEKKLPDIYKPKQGLGFFGYIFLLIIIGFSIVGILKTFENDLLNNFPEIEYIFQLLDKQLEFFSETVKNMIVIVKDLINSY